MLVVEKGYPVLEKVEQMRPCEERSIEWYPADETLNASCRRPRRFVLHQCAVFEGIQPGRDVVRKIVRRTEASDYYVGIILAALHAEVRQLVRRPGAPDARIDHFPGAARLPSIIQKPFEHLRKRLFRADAIATGI